MLKFLPEQSEIEMIHAYTGDPALLGNVEKYFLALSQIPSYQLCIEASIIRESFEDEMSDIEPTMRDVKKACKEIRSCKKLEDFLLLILKTGNFMNFGAHSGDAQGFKITSLLKLAETKANKPRMTLLHYVVMEAEKKHPELLTLPEDLIGVEKCQNVSVEQIQKDVKRLTGVISKLQRQVDKASDEIKKQFEEFLGNAADRVKLLEDNLDEIEVLRTDLANYLVEDERKFRLEDGISTFAKFSNQIKKAIKENKERAIAEEKKKKREAQEAERIKSGKPKSKRHAPPPAEENIIDNLLKDIRKGFNLKKSSPDHAPASPKTSPRTDALRKMSATKAINDDISQSQTKVTEAESKQNQQTTSKDNSLCTEADVDKPKVADSTSVTPLDRSSVDQLPDAKKTTEDREKTSNRQQTPNPPDPVSQQPTDVVDSIPVAEASHKNACTNKPNNVKTVEADVIAKAPIETNVSIDKPNNVKTVEADVIAKPPIEANVSIDKPNNVKTTEADVHVETNTSDKTNDIKILEVDVKAHSKSNQSSDTETCSTVSDDLTVKEIGQLNDVMSQICLDKTAAVPSPDIETPEEYIEVEKPKTRSEDIPQGNEEPLSANDIGLIVEEMLEMETTTMSNGKIPIPVTLPESSKDIPTEPPKDVSPTLNKVLAAFKPKQDAVTTEVNTSHDTQVPTSGSSVDSRAKSVASNNSDSEDTPQIAGEKSGDATSDNPTSKRKLRPSQIPISPQRKFGKLSFLSRTNRELATKQPEKDVSRPSSSTQRWKSLSFRKKKGNQSADRSTTVNITSPVGQNRQSKKQRAAAKPSSSKEKDINKPPQSLARNSSLRRSITGMFRNKQRPTAKPEFKASTSRVKVSSTKRNETKAKAVSTEKKPKVAVNTRNFPRRS
uniref:Inverted formin-2 n=1 Tax=Phallusia mammillata TaxID=59560 RepID=A0A6F9DEH1_9ASCI|nr:inverted formin-2 [Phallusia mammillata]